MGKPACPCMRNGVDASTARPIAHALPDGRVAVYIGGAYQQLPPEKAATLRDQITLALAPPAGTEAQS